MLRMNLAASSLTWASLLWTLLDICFLAYSEMELGKI